LLRSKVKVREWSNLGFERLLGAANGDGGGGRREEITGSKSGPVKGKSALRAARQGRLPFCYGKILEEAARAKAKWKSQKPHP
jgi:hypothetical protein